MDRSYFDPLGEREDEKLLAVKRLKATLCALVVLVLSTYLSNLLSGLLFSIVYGIFDVSYGDSYLLDSIGNMFIYTCDLLLPSVLFMLIWRLRLGDCIDFGRLVKKTERVTAFSVLRYFAVAFAMSCTFSYLISMVTFYLGIDSSVFDMPCAANAPELILDIISVAVLPALFEELLFRGIMLSVLLPYGKTFAIVTSALFFATVHGSLEQIGFAFIYGLLFAFIAVKTGSVITGVLMHFMNNALSCVMDYLFYNYPGIVTNTVSGIITLLLVLFGFIGGAHLIGVGTFDLAEEKHSPSGLDVSETVPTLLSPVMVCYFIFVALETVISYFTRM